MSERAHILGTTVLCLRNINRGLELILPDLCRVLLVQGVCVKVRVVSLRARARERPKGVVGRTRARSVGPDDDGRRMAAK
jgi:hypothetical protein